jgi:UDP-glucose 4-epimerase
VRVLITGGAGYIGSHLVDLLVDQDHDVTVLDNLSTGRIPNLSSSLRSIRFINGSILDPDLVDQEVERADLVFHLAAAVGVRHIVESPLQALLVNTRGTDHVLSSAFKRWRRVVVASTSEVYGKTAKVPMREDDDRVLGPTTVHRWSYSTAKAIDEHLALAHHAMGLPVTIVRYFNSYGPRLDPRGYGSVVANFIRQCLAGAPITVHGDGRQSRCFTFVDDTVRGTYLAGFEDAAIGLVINLGNPVETSILELAERIRDKLESSSRIELMPYESYYGPGFEDTRRRVPDITRARQVLGWSPTVELDEGLDRTVKWWLSTYQEIGGLPA